MSTSITGKRLAATAPFAPWDAIVGSGVWLAAVVVVRPGLAEAILLLAICVIVPLAIGIADDLPAGIKRLLASRTTVAVWIVAVIALCVSFVFGPGVVAGAFAAPWLAATIVLAALGAVQFARHMRTPDSRLATAAALVLIAVGGGWTLLSRLGVRPLGFSDEIVLLTGIHFHYAGFALPLLAVRATRSLNSRIRNSTLAAIVIGVPLVGLGITFSPLLELVASCVLAAGCWIVAFATLQSAVRCNSPLPATLLAVSGISLASAMVLAVIYASGEYCGAAWLDIPTMVPLHGIANAFGFTLCGLLGWRHSTFIPKG